MSEPQDILEAWKGEVQRIRREQERELDRVARDIGVTRHDLQSGRFRHKRAQEAQEAFDAQEAHRKAQEDVQALTGTLRGVRESLENMHVPGCLRVGYACPACEALTDLDDH